MLEEIWFKQILKVLYFMEKYQLADVCLIIVSVTRTNGGCQFHFHSDKSIL